MKECFPKSPVPRDVRSNKTKFSFIAVAFFVCSFLLANTSIAETVSGSVIDINGNALEGVSISIRDNNGDIVNDTTGNPLIEATAADGTYNFLFVPNGDYNIVEIDPADYISVSDGDSSADGDNATNTGQRDNIIPVTMTAGKVDLDNNFVDDNPPALDCSPGFYQSLDTDLSELDPLTGDYTVVGTASETYNAIGWDVRKNYIYGFRKADDQLIRVKIIFMGLEKQMISL